MSYGLGKACPLTKVSRIDPGKRPSDTCKTIQKQPAFLSAPQLRQYRLPQTKKWGAVRNAG